MENHTVHAFYKHVEMEIEIKDVTTPYKYEALWALTAKHVDYMRCIPEWKPFISFCLMWSTTIAQPKMIDYLKPIPQKWDISSKLDLGLYVKIISETKPENFEYEYDSKLAPFFNEPEFKFKVSMSDCLCPKPFSRLIDAFKQNIPYELKHLPCRFFFKPYNLYWDKSEDPYILKIKSKQD